MTANHCATMLSDSEITLSNSVPRQLAAGDLKYFVFVNVLVYSKAKHNLKRGVVTAAECMAETPNCHKGETNVQ